MSSDSSGISDSRRHDDTIITEVSADPERRTTARTKNACLILIYGGDLGRKYNILGHELRIGRSENNDICLPQDAVSREHALLRVAGDGIYLCDNNSTNGTFVNDLRIQQERLRDGDLVKIGRSIFKFLSGDNIERAYHEEIFRLSTIDGLTQVYNRRYFSENLDRELSRARRYERPLALIIFDIDHFKQTNDRFGHRAGDYVLRSVAALVMKRARSVDVVARYGGEEFVVILPEIDRPGAMRFAQALRTLVEAQDFQFEGESIPTAISVGVAVLHPGIASGDDILKEADQRLFQAKEQGRNRVVGPNEGLDSTRPSGACDTLG